MSDGNKLTRIVAIGDVGPTQQQITNALGSHPEFLLVEWITSLDKLARAISAAAPEIILVDQKVAEQSTLDIIDELAMQFPEAAVIAIMPDNDPVRIQQMMLAGARGFIIQPFTQINLLSTLRRVRDLEGRRMQSLAVKTSAVPEAARPLKTLTVFSPRGGAGTSTLAANLALALFEETGSKVLLMEGKLFFGHMDVLLNMRTHNTLGDLIPHVNNLDEALVYEVAIRHSSGIHVLLSPSNIQAAQGIRPDDLYKVFMALQRMFDYVVIDAGSSLTENTVTLMDSADRILLVTVPDLAALHDTSRFIQLSHSLAYPDEKIMIVLNRTGLQGGVKTNDIETSLHHQVFCQIPDDPTNALRSLNRGIPLLVRYPRSPVSRSIKNLATELLSLKTAGQTRFSTEPGGERVQSELLLASSRLG